MSVKTATAIQHLPLSTTAYLIKTATSPALQSEGDQIIRLIDQYAQETLVKADQSLPIILLFERHWDPIPKLLLKSLLPALAKQGYATFCMEASTSHSSVQMTEAINEVIKIDTDLENQTLQMLWTKGILLSKKLSEMSHRELSSLLMWHVSSKKYIELAQKIKHLPAMRLMSDILNIAKKESISLKGIDIDEESYRTMISPEISIDERSVNIKANEDIRISTFFNNLRKLREQNEGGIVFACGALHAPRLLEQFKKHQMQDSVVSYFSRCSGVYDEQENALMEEEEDFKAFGEALKNRTTVLKEEQISSFTQKIVKEVSRLIRYKREVFEGNSHTRFLSNLFHVHFRAYMRPGYYVDALLDIKDVANIQQIRIYFKKLEVETYDISADGRDYLVVPRVNVKEVAYKIRNLETS